jgi:ABC-2 type transport system permease protein
MRIILTIIQKEFIQIFRNRTMLPLIFVMPVVQMLVLVNAATFELKNSRLTVVNQDQSAVSREIISRITGSGFFTVEPALSMEVANDMMLENRIDAILFIPAGFERDLHRENAGSVQILLNAIDGMAASLTGAYIQSIISSYNREILVNEGYPQSSLPVEISQRFWYNPQLKYSIYMLPGILVILVTVIGMFLTAINIVREKEQGTIEQINVTPIKKHHFIIGKLIPFLIIALFELFFGLTIGKLIYGMPILGSLWLLLLCTFLFLLVALGLGLLVSAISQTQQQVMFTIFFLLLMFILMSGIFTPEESMPHWAQNINIINPFRYYMRTIRMILLKGSGFMDILNELIALSIYAVTALSVAAWRYKKTAS